MSEDQTTPAQSPRRWLDRVAQLLSGEPRDRDDLLAVLRDAHDRGLVDADGLAMIEGVLHVSEIQARDIMIPRSQVTVLPRDMPPREMLPVAVRTGYSRFPVTGENRDDVIGILLAKDMLRCFMEEGEDFRVREVLRPPMFIPESKRLDALLKQFREARNHMSIVVDEYGGLAGIVTIEDVIEQIVGDIDDEHDYNEDTAILTHDDGSSIVKALTPVEEFNEHFGLRLPDEEFDTIGGLVAGRLGHVPRRDEVLELDGLTLKVVRADKRRVHLLKVERNERLPAPADDESSGR